MEFIILRVGDKRENFKRSVLDKIEYDEPPIWGFQSKSFCKVTENIIRSMKDKPLYIFFLPCNKEGLIGVAKISAITKRILKENNLIDLSPNDKENGWMIDTIGNSWDYEIEIEKYWKLDSEKYNECLFGYDTLITKKDGKKFSQGTYQPVDDMMRGYINPRLRFITTYVKPDYDVTRP